MVKLWNAKLSISTRNYSKALEYLKGTQALIKQY